MIGKAASPLLVLLLVAGGALADEAEGPEAPKTEKKQPTSNLDYWLKQAKPVQATSAPAEPEAADPFQKVFQPPDAQRVEVCGRRHGQIQRAEERHIAHRKDAEERAITALLRPLCPRVFPHLEKRDHPGQARSVSCDDVKRPACRIAKHQQSAAFGR